MKIRLNKREIRNLLFIDFEYIFINIKNMVFNLLLSLGS